MSAEKDKYYTLLGLVLLGRMNWKANEDLERIWKEICGIDMDEYFWNTIMEAGDIKSNFDEAYKEMEKEWSKRDELR